MRGNNSSPAALAAHLYSLRLYRVVQAALEAEMSSVAWPVWGSALANLRHAAHDVERRGLYRLPILYRHSVQLLVHLTIVRDTTEANCRACRTHSRIRAQPGAQ